MGDKRSCVQLQLRMKGHAKASSLIPSLQVAERPGLALTYSSLSGRISVNCNGRQQIFYIRCSSLPLSPT